MFPGSDVGLGAVYRFHHAGYECGALSRLRRRCDYLAITNEMSKRSTFVHEVYARRQAAATSGYEEIGAGQPFHLDAHAAGGCVWLNLSGYERLPSNSPWGTKDDWHAPKGQRLWGSDGSRGAIRKALTLKGKASSSSPSNFLESPRKK